MDGSGAAWDAPQIVRIDVSSQPLSELIDSDDSALAMSLRRLVAEIEGHAENYAAFQSIVEGD